LQQSCRNFEIQLLNSKSKNTYQATFCSHWCPRDPTSRPFFNIDQILMYHSIPTTAPSFLFDIPRGLAREKLKKQWRYRIYLFQTQYEIQQTMIYLRGDFTIGLNQTRVKYPNQYHRYIEFTDSDVQSSP